MTDFWFQFELLVHLCKWGKQAEKDQCSKKY